MKCEEGVEGCQRFSERSLFHLPVVQQIVLIGELEKWARTEDMQDHVKRRWQVLAQTQLLEDSIAKAKRDASDQPHHQGRPMLSHHSLVKSDVLTRRHHFNQPEARSENAAAGGELLAEDAYKPTWANNPQLKLPGLVTYKQETTWYGPSAQNLPVSVGDLDVMEDVARRNVWDAIADLKLGALMDVKHSIIVRRVSAPVDEWWIPCKVIKGSGVIAWGARLATPFGGSNLFYVEPLQVQRDVKILTVLKHEDWEAYNVDWKSPASQYEGIGLI